MRHPHLSAFLALATLFGAATSGCAAQPEDAAETGSALTGNQSAWTPLNPADQTRGENHCTVLEEGIEGVLPFKNLLCPGMDEYSLIIHEIDGRQMLYVRTPTGDFDLALGWFMKDRGYLADLAEWRGPAYAIGKTHPKGLIIRYFQPTTQNPIKSYLFAAKLTHDSVCIYSMVEGWHKDSKEQIQKKVDDEVEAFVCEPLTPRPIPSPTCGALPRGTGLALGQSASSCDGSHTLVMQTDGNLVHYNNVTQKAVWQSHTAGSGATATFLRLDGSFQIYGAAFDSLWSAPVVPNALAGGLNIQDDGNLVMYSGSGKALWHSHTAGK